MNTPVQTSADVKAFAAITEADVIAWLRSHAQRIVAANPVIKTASVQIHVGSDDSSAPYYYAHADGSCVMENTIDSAVAKIIGRVGSPKQLAALKRATAAKLISEAEAIDLVAPAAAQTEVAA